MGTTSTYFTGNSQFSQDFSNVVTRAVKIASLPISQMQGDVDTLQTQHDALSGSTGIESKFVALQTAVQGIAQAMGGASYQTTVSNEEVLRATVADGATEGNYTIEVLDVGSYATSTTASTWVNSSGPAHTYQLWIGDKSDPNNEIDITPTNNSVKSVAAAINLRAGNQVRATAVNVGSTSEPDWRITLQANALGATALDLVDGSSPLQTQQTVGSEAKYVVNNTKNADGSPKVVSSTSRSVSPSDGLTVDLLSAAPGSPIDVTVIRSTAALSTALSSFATAYNDVVDVLDQQRGQKDGALAGQSIIYNLGQVLSGLATYTDAGAQIGGLPALGMDLGIDGKLTFNSFSLIAADITSSAGVTAFLGSAKGGGFLKAATDALNGVEDSTSGLIKMAEANLQTQIDYTNGQISDKQAQVDALEQQLLEQMSAADAAISAMEQQYSYFSNMFQAMQTADQQYK